MKKLIIGTLVLISAVLVQCASNGKDKKEPLVSPSWESKMREMAINLEALVPYLFSKEEFESPDNKEKVRKLLREFTVGVEGVPKHVGEAMLGKDPLIHYSLQQLEANSHRSVQAFNEGRLDFSRRIMRGNIGICFNCHTSQNFGPRNNFSDTSLSQNFKIKTTERADFYIATRQFDKANSVLESMLKTDESVLDNTAEQMNALRKFLVLQVRVRQKPDYALGVVNEYAKTHKLPYFINRDLEVWRKSLQVWLNDSFNKKLQRVDALTQAQALIKKAEATQEVNGYQTGFVEYLRATELLHSGLRATSDAGKKAKMLELLGYAYETIPEIGFWELPQIYYETCIRTAPKSPVAKSCYQNFERALILGYTGSAGTFVPQDERVRMHDLEVLSGN